MCRCCAKPAVKFWLQEKATKTKHLPSPCNPHGWRKTWKMSLNDTGCYPVWFNSAFRWSQHIPAMSTHPRKIYHCSLATTSCGWPHMWRWPFWCLWSMVHRLRWHPDAFWSHRSFHWSPWNLAHWSSCPSCRLAGEWARLAPVPHFNSCRTTWNKSKDKRNLPQTCGTGIWQRIPSEGLKCDFAQTCQTRHFFDRRLVDQAARHSMLRQVVRGALGCKQAEAHLLMALHMSSIVKSTSSQPLLNFQQKVHGFTRDVGMHRLSSTSVEGDRLSWSCLAAPVLTNSCLALLGPREITMFFLGFRGI